MDLKEAIFRRRSVRAYTGEPVPAATVNELLLAAVQAPSGLNQQPWAFGVFEGRRRLHDFSERAKHHLATALPAVFELHPSGEDLTHPSYDIFHGAGTLIVIYSLPGRLNPAEDCCLAAQNLMLAAQELGLGTCPIGYARLWLNQPEIKAELGVATDLTAVFPVVVGHPAEQPAIVPRHAPEIVAWFRAAP